MIRTLVEAASCTTNQFELLVLVNFLNIINIPAIIKTNPKMPNHNTSNCSTPKAYHYLIHPHMQIYYSFKTHYFKDLYDKDTCRNKFEAEGFVCKQNNYFQTCFHRNDERSHICTVNRTCKRK